LRNEPYWSALSSVFDWAERNTTSTVLSCLAAHAGVLYSDGIVRRPLGDKQFGVFGYRASGGHELLSGLGDLVRFPHSRWNEVPAEPLVSCGYQILTESTDAGVDMFVKQKRNSLFVHFQGHPEYGALTLMREYRRDIRRFLKGERATYPSMPHGYFNMEATKQLGEFRERASRGLHEELMQAFPEDLISGTLENSWQSSAVCIYQNWLQYVASKKFDRSVFAQTARVGHA
jgi:homoserine O-succinyltransferase/O-acetyltransferase